MLNSRTHDFNLTRGKLHTIFSGKHLEVAHYRKIEGWLGLKKDKGRNMEGSEVKVKKKMTNA